jgi:translation initiation factor 1
MPRHDDARLVYSTGRDPVRECPPERLPADKPPSAAGVRIRLDRRASGRLVTVVTGLPSTRDALNALARSLKTACGAGGTVKRDAIELQGDHRDVVESELRQRGFKPKRAGG